jgi:uncharacterized protein (DUF1015 family)
LHGGGYHPQSVPELTAFHGLRYDERAVNDISAVLCPPYDVISAEERARLASLDPRNAVNVELPVAGPVEGNSRYQAAARTLSGWLADGTLRRDDRPMVYVYEQRYSLADGLERSAMGFFCRLRLEPYGPDSGVLPHEHTMSGPKEDRFQLLTATRANLSPVLFLYDDGAAGAASSALMTELTSRPPDVEGVGPGGLVNRLWVADPQVVESAGQLLAVAGARPVYIADGHHRYETALRFRDASPGVREAEFVLSLMYEAHAGGLALLPWHRVLRGIDSGAVSGAISRSFSMEPVDSAEQLLHGLSASPTPGTIGFWTPEARALLRVKQSHDFRLSSAVEPETLRRLDVSVVSDTLREMTGTEPSSLANDGRLSYTSDARAAIETVDAGQADLVFLLRPTPTEVVLEVARAGGYMPPKSTFFHPKAATGLVFNPLS